MTTWFNLSTPSQIERLEQAWPGAPIEQVELCSMLLDVAREQVIAYAPSVTPAPTETPARLVYAQLQQAQNLWNAGQANPDGGQGPDGFTFTPRPLDKTIRGIIRPTTGAADVF